MPLRVLIIPDKFKGTLTAKSAARAIAAGWRKARPHDSLTLLPMTDGGDGFGEVFAQILAAKSRAVVTVDAAGRRLAARWDWEPKSKTAVVETARVIGLALLPPGRFHPFDLDTCDLAAVFRAVAARGARRCVVGIGGSATNDGGFGMARALGWKFLRRSGIEIERWADLGELAQIQRPDKNLDLGDLTVAVDVRNPLLGARGATRIYGPQKGLRPPDLPSAERCLQRLATLFEQQFGGHVHTLPGAGAAGGLGFGLAAFLGARLESGFDLFARHSNLERRLRAADLVITGEGAIDKSTLMGKGVGQIARRCRSLKIPCIGLVGILIPDSAFSRTFTAMHSLAELAGAEAARAKAAHWLNQLSERTAAEWISP